ncbi:MAG TPA: thiol peroxidase [Bacteroidales bacterium]|nr:thiol peroxidase [Bacteroidales bacterium]HPT01488.1 thiol peroxidase [Bacteroidales bacterium]
MSVTKFKGNPVNTFGDLPVVGSKAPSFELVKSDLSDLKLEDLSGKRVILNIFPSLDTAVCAASVRRFNVEAARLPNTVVVCISKDLPFAHSRFCTTEGIKNVVTASEFRSNNFGKSYGVMMTDGPLRGLMARAVVVIDEGGKVVYHELVPEIAQEPDYESAVAVR